MKGRSSFFRRFFQSSISRLATVMLVALAWTSLAFGGEIHDAAANGDLAKVQLLLKDHPDLVFSKDDLGRTPLHVAAGSGHKDVAELFLAHQADVHAEDNFGRTALHWAAVGGHKDVAECLLAHHADVNAKDNFGRTALHWAAVGGHKDVAELLESAMAANEPAPAPAPTPAPENTPAPSPSPPILPSQLTASSSQWVSHLSRQCILRGSKSACRELARVAVEDKDAIVRSAAVANLADQSLLAKIAVEDKDARVRYAAVAKLTDQPLLAKIAVEDKDARVRSAAADSQAGYNSKTGLSKTEALQVLGVFLMDAYNSDVPYISHALARDANSHPPPGWGPMEQLVASMLANVPIGGFITLKDFTSIDETGYEFTSTRLYCAGRSRGTSSRLPEIFFTFDQGRPVRVRFADVRRIKMTSVWSSGGETYVNLLGDPAGVVHKGQGSSILDSFPLYNRKDPNRILPALHTLCPNLK